MKIGKALSFVFLCVAIAAIAVRTPETEGSRFP
jgi:hypothetical protein